MAPSAKARFALWLVALLAAGNSSAGAQVVRGTVTDERTAGPVRAVVTLLTADSQATDRRALTSADGTYALRAPSAGTFVLEVRAIGFVRQRIAPLSLVTGETRVENVVLRPIATRLASVRVPARSSCRRTSDMERVATEVWDDIWTALASAAIAQEQQLVRADVFRYARELDAQSEVVRWEERNTLSGMTDRPFRAAPPGDLARLGFRHESDDGTSVTFFAPDAQTLISTEFLATHCFALTRIETAGVARLGLVFRPQDARAPNEVEGTLWLDAESRELRTLEFTYTGLPDLRGRRFGGRLSFMRLQNGLWVDDRWLIRAPLLRRLIRGTQRFRGLRLEGEVRDSVLAVREEGGFVLTDFIIDWQAHHVTCPADKVSTKWSETQDRFGEPTLHVAFAAKECLACPLRVQCTRAQARHLSLRAQPFQERLQTARLRQATPEFKTLYRLRAGIEGTLSQAVRAFDLRHSRYIGLPKTHLQHILTAIAINLFRLVAWWNGDRPAQTQRAPRALYAHLSRHGGE